MSLKDWIVPHVFCLLAMSLICGCCAQRNCENPAEDVEKLFSATPSDYRTSVVNRMATKTTEKSYHALILSGGGANGAWGAGFLNGWASKTKRPAFDVITGVSTGALIATGAFVGNDTMLKEAYTTTSNSDIANDRFFFTIPFSNSLKNTAPLKRLIAKYVTNAVIDEVAKGGMKHRRLYVGSVDLDSGKLIIWDLTRIAAAAQKDPARYNLYREVIFASASAPFLFPPVEIGGHLHVDGGVRASLFYRNYLQPRIKELKAGANMANPDLYVINDGTIGVDPQCTQNCLLPIVERSISCLLDANGLSSILETAQLTDKKHFHLSYIPPGVSPVSSFDFNTKEMTRLYNAGFESGAKLEWREAPDPEKFEKDESAF
jgi:predicted acylesterase/phospholipase RssA